MVLTNSLLIRPLEVLSGIFDSVIVKEAAYAFRVRCQPFHMSFGGITQFGSGLDRDFFADGLFEVCVQAFLGIEFRAVTGQLEYFDFIRALCQPCLDRLGMVNP
jgi:hypothetical protein